MRYCPGLPCLISSYVPTHATKWPRVGDSGAWSRNAITSRPSLVHTPMWRSPVSPHGVSTGVLQVVPSSLLNIIRL